MDPLILLSRLLLLNLVLTFFLRLNDKVFEGHFVENRLKILIELFDSRGDEI